MTCTRATLPVGAAPVLTLTVRAPATPGAVTASTTVNARNADLNPDDNTASAVPVVVTPATGRAIPTLAPWDLAALAALLGAVGAWRHRRRFPPS